MPELRRLGQAGITSSGNSSTTLLTNGSTFTGSWEDVGVYATVTVAVATDQNGTYTIEFSPDGVNQDSTLTRYYRTDQFNVPHNFTITRQYCRITFTNNSGSDQTYLRLQTLYGNRPQLNVPCDSTVAQDYDAVVVRPTDYQEEVARGLRQGVTLWNKFGKNTDVDSAAPEVVANFGGAVSIFTTGSTYTFSSSSLNDDSGGTGCESLIFYGVDSNWDITIEVISTDGTTPVVTTTSWVSYPNRVAMYLCGSGQTNDGDITVTRTTGGATVALLTAGEGVTQQNIFTIAEGYQWLTEWLFVNSAKQAGGNPVVTWKIWVYSAVSNGTQEVFSYQMDTQDEVSKELLPKSPFPIGEKSIVWIEATTTRNDTFTGARISGKLYRDADE